jgi:hypothetical protein
MILLGKATGGTKMIIKRIKRHMTKREKDSERNVLSGCGN